MRREAKEIEREKTRRCERASTRERLCEKAMSSKEEDNQPTKYEARWKGEAHCATKRAE